eukprot:6186456-Pleurochrysis_carterae.AAC.2
MSRQPWWTKFGWMCEIISAHYSSVSGLLMSGKDDKFNIIYQGTATAGRLKILLHLAALRRHELL